MGRCGDEQVLRQTCSRIHCIFRHDQPSETPTGHTKILGKTVDHEDIVCQLQRRPAWLAIFQSMVDLIGKQKSATIADFLTNRCKLLRIDDRSCRIGRRSDPHPTGSGLPMALYHIRSQVKIGFRAYRNQNRFAIVQMDHMAIARISRITHQDLITRLQNQRHDKNERTGCSRCQNDSFLRHRHVVTIEVIV